MGVFDWLKAPTPTSDVVRPLDRDVFDHSAAVRAATAWALSLGPESVWETQPYVRTVVTFLARNIAQLGVHTFKRIDEDQRERVRDHPVAQLLSRPNSSTTTFELIFGLVCDRALYDRAYWLIGSENGRPTLSRLPPARVTQHIAADPLGSITAFRVAGPRGEHATDVPASRVLYFPGWNPTSAVGMPSSPLDAIKSVIAEQAAAFEFRKLSWENGAQVSASITRPQGVPWKDGARERFISDVRAQYGGKGPRRAGVMLLEDGMTMESQQFNAREAEWIDAAKLSLSLVAAVYHVNPTMVGLLDNANYSNVREFRKMLYGDTLGPIMASIEDRLNSFLVPRFDDAGDIYVEFNIAEKLQGSFEEQAAAMQTSVGAPWMTRSEARARLNLPPLDTADELIVPLNVLAGGQASPTDSAPPASAASRTLKSADACCECGNDAPCEGYELCSDCLEAGEQKTARVVSISSRRQLARELVAFFEKQSSSVCSRIGAGDSRWWDGDRWDDELSAVLRSHVDDADAIASGINASTKSALDVELAADDPNPAAVFSRVRESRAAGIAL